MSDESAGAGKGAAPSDAIARLAELERENARLRRRLDEVQATFDDTSARPARHRGRAAAAVVLITLGALLAPAGVVAAWAERTLTDTDRYVATVAPLADDPTVQSAVSGRLTEAVMSRIDVGAVVDGVAAGLAGRDVPPRVTNGVAALEAPLTSGIESFVRRTADGVVRSDQFESAWDQANRVAHEQFVAVMRGEGGDIVQVGEEGQLTIQLAPMTDLLKQRLGERGFGLATRLPTIDASFTIVESTQLVEIRNRYAQVVALGTWLPWIALGLLAAGVLAATHRLRALVAAGLALVAAMLVLAVALAITRGLYLDALSGQVARLDAAEAVFDQLVTFLRGTLRTVGVLGLVVALAAYLGGSSASARSLRAAIGKGMGRTRDWAEGQGVTTGPAGVWLGEHRGVVRTAVIALAALVVLLAPNPTPGLVVGVAIGAGLVITLIELLARPVPAARDPGREPVA
ncbi:hypothetical protein [Myceligenerans pegani]|uniref:Integral membrane protein n=1 Tax=Myceligenerans pegani TaxID=2776917 RepID=A0ABR9MWS8_9MICO|nr:hypothetical protein [Myceligenerans sp. TRM 65318]MBE1875848.1 hypothetical protein [Myceligenerans sp. TRM 65318]MBE3018119.1 hypothetical protein [Myceligenerans sp. TRM 65318]